MKLQAGEVVLIRMQFHQAPGAKIRPALVVLDSGDDDFIAAPVTSQSRFSDYDLTLADWQSAGLNVPSTVRMHKLAVLAKSDIVRRLGICSAVDRESAVKLLCGMFCPR